MINKRLLVKNLLAYNNENSFYDKKRQLNLHTKEGKAKFLKHICALSNSNPFNNSYIVVGVEDDTNEIVGDDFFDDSRIQNLVNAYLENPPKILYENIPFPILPEDKVVGLVTIKPKSKMSSFKKNIYTIFSGQSFERIGSNSSPTFDKIPFSKSNVETVLSIENSSRNSIKNTLDEVVDFMYINHKDLEKQYLVFKENFVICWAGQKKIIKQNTYYSRVDIELVNEQVKLFYSTFDEVSLSWDNNSFTILEYLHLGINDQTTFYPFEKTVITFFDNGYYKIDSELLFEMPQYDKRILHHIYNNALKIIDKMEKNLVVDSKELINLPSTFMICYLSGFIDAKEKLIQSKPFFKSNADTIIYQNYKESLRILRKLKYSN